MYLIYWDQTLVGMASVLPMPCGTSKYSFRQHRLVILPDFQGLGIGTKVNDFIARYYVNNGDKYFIRTTHLRMNNHLSSSVEWKATSTNGRQRSEKDINRNKANKSQKGDLRIAGSFEYVGEDYVNKPHKNIVIDVSNSVTEEELLSLRDKYYLTIVTGKPKEDNETELLCKKLGIRTEQLYYNRKGVLVRKNVS